MRVVTRDALMRVYDKVWKAGAEEAISPRSSDAESAVAGNAGTGKDGSGEAAGVGSRFARFSRFAGFAAAAPRRPVPRPRRLVLASPSAASIYFEVPAPTGRSFNGRTPRSGRGYRGSNPCLPATKFALCFQQLTAQGDFTLELFDRATLVTCRDPHYRSAPRCGCTSVLVAGPLVRRARTREMLRTRSSL